MPKEWKARALAAKDKMIDAAAALMQTEGAAEEAAALMQTETKLVRITVPSWAVPGDTLLVRIPDSNKGLRFTVPDGSGAGHVHDIPVPTNLDDEPTLYQLQAEDAAEKEAAREEAELSLQREIYEEDNILLFPVIHRNIDGIKKILDSATATDTGVDLYVYQYTDEKWEGTTGAAGTQKTTRSGKQFNVPISYLGGEIVVPIAESGRPKKNILHRILFDTDKHNFEKNIKILQLFFRRGLCLDENYLRDPEDSPVTPRLIGQVLMQKILENAKQKGNEYLIQYKTHCLLLNQLYIIHNSINKAVKERGTTEITPYSCPHKRHFPARLQLFSYLKLCYSNTNFIAQKKLTLTKVGIFYYDIPDNVCELIIRNFDRYYVDQYLDKILEKTSLKVGCEKYYLDQLLEITRVETMFRLWEFFEGRKLFMLSSPVYSQSAESKLMERLKWVRSQDDPADIKNIYGITPLMLKEDFLKKYNL